MEKVKMSNENQIIYNFFLNILNIQKQEIGNEDLNFLITEIKNFIEKHKDDFKIKIENEEQEEKLVEIKKLFNAELTFYNNLSNNKNMYPTTQKLQIGKIILDSIKNFPLPPWLKILVDIVQEVIQIKQILTQTEKTNRKTQEI